jgi:hypothetical protein
MSSNCHLKNKPPYVILLPLSILLTFPLAHKKRQATFYTKLKISKGKNSLSFFSPFNFFKKNIIREIKKQFFLDIHFCIIYNNFNNCNKFHFKGNNSYNEKKYFFNCRNM